MTLCRTYWRATALAEELYALADEKDAPPWKANGSMNQGVLFALYWQCLECNSDDYVGDHSVAADGSNIGDAVVVVALGDCIHQSWPTR